MNDDAPTIKPVAPQDNLNDEASAEEAFVADAEDKTFNPLIEDNESSSEEAPILSDQDMEIPGAVGSGSLETVLPNAPVDNEVLQIGQEDKMQNTNTEDFQSDIEKNISSDGAQATPNFSNSETENGVESVPMMDGENTETSLAEATTPVSVEKPTTEISTAETTMAENPVATTETPVVETAPMPSLKTEKNDENKTGEKKKKGKTGLIIGVIVLIVLLIGCGVASILFVNWHESKAKVASDAFMKLTASKLENGKVVSDGAMLGVTKLNGEITLVDEGVSEYEKDSIFSTKEVAEATLKLDASADKLNQSATGNLKLKFNNGDESDLVIGASYIEGGSLYAKIENLDDLKEEIFGKSAVSNEDQDEEEKVQQKIIDRVIGKVLDVVDGQWVRIDNDGIRELIGNKTDYNDEFDCATKGYEKMAKENKDATMKAFQEHVFIELGDTVKDLNGAEKDYTYYELKIDDQKLKDFSKAVEDAKITDEISKCFENEKNSTKIYDDPVNKNNEEDDTESETEDDIVREKKIYVGIKSWTHEMEHAIFDISSTKKEKKYNSSSRKYETAESKKKIFGNLHFGYEKTTVVAPADSKSLKETIKAIPEAFYDGFKESRNDLIELNCGKDSADKSCIAAVDEQIAEMKDQKIENIINF